MGWARTHRARGNRRPYQLMQKKPGRPKELFRTLGRLGTERGPASENHLSTMLRELVADGRMLQVHESETTSWADVFLKADIIVRRLDGEVVPIQAKSTYGGVQHFGEKWADHCIELFGRLPVCVVVPPEGFVAKTR